MRIETVNLQNQWKLYTLTNDNGMSVKVLNYGGIITEVLVPDKDNKVENVVLGYKNIKDYETDPNFFGAIIGRVGGRIQGATFQLDGKTYHLEHNDGENHLHSGAHGFHRVIWDVEVIKSDEYVGLALTHFSPNHEGGYPGNVKAVVTYTLNNQNQLSLHYGATSDQTTVLTLTNHTYFNLTGNLSDTILNHHVTVDSSCFVELNDQLIPTGEIVEVDESPFDFRNGRKLADGIHSDYSQNTIVGNGYDHYFLFEHKKKEQVMVKEDKSGRVLTVETDQPGMVMYTGNNLSDGLSLNGASSTKHLGVCFETQGSPASIHHTGLPSIILKAGEAYEKKTVFTFQN